MQGMEQAGTKIKCQGPTPALPDLQKVLLTGEFAGKAFPTTPLTARAASQMSCVSLDKSVNTSVLQLLQSK